MTNHEAIGLLESAAKGLEQLQDAAFSDEAKALSVLIRTFANRIGSVESAPPNPNEVLDMSPRDDGEPRHWPKSELDRVGIKIPFSPFVYCSSFWQRKEKLFHTPSCHLARDGDSILLENAIERGFKPCSSCGGVQFELNPVALANQIDELLRLVHEVRRFELEDFKGMISLFDASTILDVPFDELEKDCRKAASEQLRHVKGDYAFQLSGDINVLRYKEHPHDKRWSFRFVREDCVRDARKYGRIAYPYFKK